MASSTLIIAEMLITLGLCLGFGFWQLWDLRREKAKDAAKDAAKAAAEAACQNASATAAGAQPQGAQAHRQTLRSDAAS
jgi:hypothetical protein